MSLIYSREGTQASNLNHPGLREYDCKTFIREKEKNNNKLCTEDHYVM